MGAIIRVCVGDGGHAYNGAAPIRSRLREGGRCPLETLAAARDAVDVASDRQASDILLLDVSQVSSFADYLVIMTADNPRQMDTLAEELDYALERDGHPLHHREGTVASGWVLLDFGDIVAHVFTEEMRDYYQLDQLWGSGRQIVRIQ